MISGGDFDLEIGPLGQRAPIPPCGVQGCLYGMGLGALRIARRVAFRYKEPMKTKLPLTVISALLFNTITCTGLFAQGALAPAGPPAPTMKSLQEIWERIDALKVAHAANLASLEARNASNLALLLSSLGGILPFQLSTVDSVGQVGEFNSLAFNPGGAPAISYFDRTNLDLKYAVYNGASWDLSTVDSVGTVGD